jgi:hypothetical protein
MKYMVSRKNCYWVLLWYRMALRYLPRRVLKLVWVTRQTI